jgi:hypothetical protein
LQRAVLFLLISEFSVHRQDVCCISEFDTRLFIGNGSQYEPEAKLAMISTISGMSKTFFFSYPVIYNILQ